MSYTESIQREKDVRNLTINYNTLSDKYTGELYQDTDFIGNSYFGIDKDLFTKVKSSKAINGNKDIVSKYLKPWLEDRKPTPDWRSVDGVSGKWGKNTIVNSKRIRVNSIRKLTKHTAIDFDFCKLFSNHWFMYCADYETDNRHNNFPIFAHNKKTGRLEGYIFPVREYDR